MFGESFYKCSRCGKVVRESDLKKVFDVKTMLDDEPYGEYLYDYECDCGGLYQPAVKCKCCGEYFIDEFEDCLDVCDSCLDKEVNFENMLLVGEEYKESVEINGFLASCFTENEIEKLLIDFLEKSEEIKKKMVKEYYDTDKMFFADWIAKKKQGE